MLSRFPSFRFLHPATGTRDAEGLLPNALAVTDALAKTDVERTAAVGPGVEPAPQREVLPLMKTSQRGVVGYSGLGVL